MKKLVREFFFLRKGERWTLFVISLILLAASVFRLLILSRPVQYSAADHTFLENMKDMMDSIQAEEDQRTYQAVRPVRSDPELKLFEFDPNSVSEEELLSMNMPGNVADNILSYRKAGGSFKEIEDMRRIYGMTDELFDSVRNYIVLTERVTDTENVRKVAARLELSMIELNKADTLTLCRLPGIGMSYSRRIIKYRDLLGGYYRPEQLLEVYGLDSAIYERVKSWLLIDTLEIKKINLNQASFKQLFSHPYLNRESVFSILDYRDYVTEIQNVSELLEQHILDEESYWKIHPYLE